MALNLGTILRTSAAARPEHPALKLDERVVSYRELDRAARGVAQSLRDRGLAPGSQIALMIPNVPEFTMAYFGILYAGCTVVPLNVLLTAPEVSYHLKDSEARLLVARKPVPVGAPFAEYGRAEGLIRGESAGIDVIRANASRPVRGKVKCDGPGLIILEVERRKIVGEAVDAAAEVHRRLPGEVVPLVVASRDIEVSAAKPSGTVAGEIEPVSIEGKHCRVIVELGVNGGAEILRGSPGIVNAGPPRDPDVITAKSSRAV